MSKEAQMMIPVPFHADTVWATERNGDVLVAVKPICENLGLDWKSQHRRIAKSPILKEGVVIMTIPSVNGKQDTTCLPLELIPGWLFGVEVGRARPEIRERLKAYQRECFKALWGYFRGGVNVDARAADGARAHRTVEAHLHPHQLRVLAAVKAYGQSNVAMVYDAPGLSEVSVDRSLLLLVYLGVIEIEEGGGTPTTFRYVPPERRPPLPLPIVKARKAAR